MATDYIEIAETLLAKHEGFSGVPYTDTEGFPTIGFGTKLPITREEGMALLRHRMREAVSAAALLFANFDELDDARKGVLIDMAYNLGYGNLSKFVKFRAAVAAEDWERAVAEMLDSKWAKQVKGRAKYLAKIIETGGWPIA